MALASHGRALAPSRAQPSCMRRAGRVPAAVPSAKMILYEVPASNNGARNRYIIRKKGLEGKEVEVRSPQTLGGLKSPDYLRLNPQGKMPLLVLEDGTPLPESEVISTYLLDKFADRAPLLTASTPEARARAALATRIHDVYMVPIQGCMYRTMDSAAERSRQVGQIAFQLDVLEGIVQGPYIAGDEMTSADAALFPTFTFMEFMLPQFFGWRDLFANRPKLRAWWLAVQKDAVAVQIINEIRGGLQGWATNHRWRDQGILDHVADKQYKWSY